MRCGGDIYGSDLELRELGPVRKDVQTEEAAQGLYEDLPFDMPENLEEGQILDAELHTGTAPNAYRARVLSLGSKKEI